MAREGIGALVSRLRRTLAGSPEAGGPVDAGQEAERREAPPACPSPQLAVPCRVTHVVDGDTVDVELALTLRVRLLDCWAPELSDLAGLTSKKALQKRVEGQEATLQVPIGDDGVLRDIFSFGRVLGRLWVTGQDVSQLQVKDGHAAAEKGA